MVLYKKDLRETELTIPKLERLAKVLNCSVNELLDTDQPKEKEVVISEIKEMINNLSDDKIRILYKIIEDVIK